MHQATVRSGTSATTASSAPCFQIIKMARTAQTLPVASDEVEDSQFGDHGVLFMADCGVIPERPPNNLRNAVSTAHSPGNCSAFGHASPCSFSTKGSESHPDCRVQAATALAAKKLKRKISKQFRWRITGDAAIVPELPLANCPKAKSPVLQTF